MKKIHHIFAAILFSVAIANIAYGQNNVTTTTGGTANQLPKFTSGTNVENSQITDDGVNVGIGIALPLSKLHVSGGNIQATQGSFLAATSLSQFPVNVSSSTSNTFMLVTNTATTAAGVFMRGGGVGTKGVIIHSTGPGNLQGTNKLIYRTSDSIDIYTQLLDGANVGYLGLGTINPTQRLEVAGTVYSTTGGFKFPDGSTQTTAGVQQNSSATFSSVAVSNLSGTGDRIVGADASGNLKISSFTPSAALSWEVLGNTINPGEYIGTNNAEDLVFKTNGTERMRIHEGGNHPGNVGIGTIPNTLSNTQGNYKVDVNGDLRIVTGGGQAGGNIVLKTSLDPDPNNPNVPAAKVGIGTENPVRALHIYTEHPPDLGPPAPCPNNDPDCIPVVGSHMGMRLENLTGTANPIRSIWDIAPFPDKFVIGSGNLTDENINAKMVILNNGNVGIGTTNPQAKLDVSGTGKFSGSVGIGTAPNSQYKLDVGGTINATQFLKNGQPFANEWATASNGTDVYNTNTGNVGIGTNSPTEKLEIAGNIKATGVISTAGKIQASAFASTSPLIFEAPIGVERMRIDDVTGYVGIGTTNPIAPLMVRSPGNTHIDIATTDAAYNSFVRLMAVTSNNRNEAQLQYVGRFSFVEPISGTMRLTIDESGTVHCKKLRVATTWSDFVFDEDYQRMNYDEKENFYKKNKHLPNIPSGKEIETEGLDVGGVMKGMMQNIEEDRLDITELFKRIEQIEKENAELKKQIAQLKK